MRVSFECAKDVENNNSIKPQTKPNQKEGIQGRTSKHKMRTRSKAKILKAESFFDAKENDEDEDLEMFYDAQQLPNISPSPRK